AAGHRRGRNEQRGYEAAPPRRGSGSHSAESMHMNELVKHTYGGTQHTRLYGRVQPTSMKSSARADGGDVTAVDVHYLKLIIFAERSPTSICAHVTGRDCAVADAVH